MGRARGVGVAGRGAYARSQKRLAAIFRREAIPAELVAGMLARQQRLLVLDNFESLLGGNERSPVSDPVAVVLKILQAAPTVRIVVTSREVLGLQEEWIYDVRGLA